MRKVRRTNRFALSTFATVLAISIVFAFGKARKPAENGNKVNMTFWVSREFFAIGDTVWFALSIANHSDDTIRFVLPTPQAARFTIYRGERPVWFSDYGVMFIQMLTPLAIAPGDSLPIRAFWLGKDNNANLLPLGKYIVEACFMGNNKCFRDSLWLVD